MIVYTLTDSLKLETAKRHEFPNDRTLSEALEELGYKPYEVDAYSSDGIIADFDKSYFSCLVTAKIQGKHAKNILKVVVGAALLIASGGALGAIAGVLHTTGTVVHALGAGLLLSGGGSLIKGMMKMPQISSFGSESIEQSYEWNVGNLSTSKGPKGITFGNNVIPEGELLAFRTFGETDDEPITSTRTDTWTDTTFIAGNSTYAGTTTKTQNVTDRRGRTYTDYVRVNKYRHSRTVTDIVGSKITDSSQILELLIGAGEGPVTINAASIKINGTPILDIPEAEYAIRSGTNNQSAFDSVIDNQTFNLSVNASLHQILYTEAEASWPDAVTYTTPSECQSVEIALSSNAWYLMDMTSGAHNKAYLKYQIRYRKQGTSAWTLKEVTTIYPILANRAYYRSTSIKLPSKGIWEFQVQNLSAKLNYQAQLLSEEEFRQIPDRAVIDIKLVSITGYVNDSRSYPNTALLYLRLPATQAINGSLPSITWKQSRPYCYAWTGSEYVQKPLDNLAWAIYDCLVQIRLDQFDNSLHVLGWNKDKVDYPAFVEFATFCESINAKGNWFLSKKTSVYELVQDLALSCRACIGFRYGKVSPFWDCPKEVKQIFTAGNMVAGSYSGGYLLPANRASQLDCTFNDENNNYESTTIRVSLDGIDDGSDASAIAFVGLSSVNAVYNAAYYLLRRNKYLKRTFNFTAGRDALVAEVGDVVGIQLDVMQWGAGGRIIKVEGDKVTLDRNVTLQSGTTYALRVTHPDGTLERKTPDETSGTYAVLTFSRHPFSTPVTVYDVYSFGVINAETKPFKIESITSDYNQVDFQIECSEYNENVYAEGSAPEIDYSRLNAGISDYAIKTSANGDIDLTWKATEGTAYVKVYVGNAFVGIGVNGFTLNAANSTSNIRLIPVSNSGFDGTSVESEVTANIGTPSMPVAPNVVPFSTGAVAIFEPVPENEYVSQLVIFENGTEIARAPVNGAVASVQIQLGGGTHNLLACYKNVNNKLGTGRSFTASPTLIDAPDVVADWIVSGVFETAEGVGESVGGVRFNSNGIQGWREGDCLFDLNSRGLSRIGGWYIGAQELYNSNIALNSGGYMQTIDYSSGYKGWHIGKEGDAEFNDIRARGAIKSTVFEYDEVSAVGGQQLINPGGVLASAYSSLAFVAKYADSYLDAEYSILNQINDTSYTRESVSFSSYQDFYDYEKSLWFQNNIILDYSQFGKSIRHEEDYSVENATAELSECFSLLNLINDSSYAMPSVSSALTYEQYVEMESGYWAAVAEINDDPPAFIPSIKESDSVLYLKNTNEFLVGDIIRAKDGPVNDFWGKVIAKGDDSTGEFISVKALHNSVFDMEAGQTIVNYRQPAKGGILLDGNAPKIDIYTHDGEPWNGLNNWIRLGNLKGIGGIADDRFGLFMGSASSHFLRYDEHSGKLFMRGEIVVTGGETYDAIASAQSTANTAVADAASAQSTANAAVVDAASAQSTANAAVVDAASAQSTANTAVANAASAQSTANTAVADAASAQSTANTAVADAASAQSTANTAVANAASAQSSADDALAFRNAVANTGYTSIKGGSVTTGTVKNSTYMEPSDQKFSVGSGFDLDNGHIHTPYLYSNSSGAGIKGYVEATSGKFGVLEIQADGSIHTPYFYSNSSGAGIKGYVEADSGKFGVLEIQANGSIKSDVTYNTDYANDPGSIELTRSIFNPETGVYKRTSHSKSGCGFLDVETLDFTNSAYTTWNARHVYIKSDSIKIAEWGLTNVLGTDKIKLFYNSGINKYGIVVGSSSDGYLTVNGDISASGTITSSRGTCQGSSDENLKTRIKDVYVLNALKSLRVKKWNYKDDLKNAHIGPMAKDFNEAFGVNGESSKLISFHDTAGVALRAVQELAEQLDGLKRQCRFLKKAIMDKGLITKRDIAEGKRRRG